MDNRKRFLAMFGPRNAGKTVFLAALYGSAEDRDGRKPGCHVSAAEDPEDPTHAYLSELYRRLIEGHFPDATVFSQLRHLTFAFTHDGRRHDVVIPDVAGEVARRAEAEQDFATAEAQIKAEILESFQDYHGYMVFVPADAPAGQPSVEYKWQVDALLNALKERTRDGGMIQRPVAVVVSKWDLQTLHPGDDAAETEKAQQFMESVFSELAAGLKATCANVGWFPVSATGPLDDGKPPRTLRPYNLAAPIAWLMETSDRVRLETAEEYAVRHERELFCRVKDDPQKRRHWQIAVARLQGFLEEVPEGELAERAQARLRGLYKRRRQRRWRRYVLVPALAAILAASVFGGLRDRAAYRAAKALLEAPTPDAVAHEVIDDVDGLLRDPTRIVGRTVGWWTGLRRLREEYESAHVELEFAQIDRAADPVTTAEADALVEQCRKFDYHQACAGQEKCGRVEEVARQARRFLAELRSRNAFEEINNLYEKYQENPKEDLRVILQEKCETFRRSFPESPRVSEVLIIVARLKADGIKIVELTSFAKLESELASKSENPWACYLLCMKWLELPVNRGSPQSGLVVRWLQWYLGRADDAAWADVQAFAGKDPTYYSEILSKLDRTYLANALFTRHREEAEKFKKTTLRNWDRHLYEQIRKRELAGNGPADVLAVRERCQGYINEGPQRTMEKEVKDWLAWFDGLQSGKTFTVTLKSVFIGKGSRFDSFWYWPNIYVTVNVGGTSHKTGVKECDIDQEARDFPASQMGTFHWKWGDRPLQVCITCTDFSDETLTFAPLPAADDFKLRFLNDEVPFDGGKIKVRLECPAAVPPSLPPYRENK